MSRTKQLREFLDLNHHVGGDEFACRDITEAYASSTWDPLGKARGVIMMGSDKRREVIDPFLRYFENLLLFLSALLIGLSKVPAVSTPFDPKKFTAFQHWVWIPILLIPVAIWLVKVFRLEYGHPGKWQIIWQIVEGMRTKIFEKDDNATAPSDRVTLFKRRRIHLDWHCFNLCGCVVPVERSGHVTRKSRAVFLASDSAAQGVAGQAWLQDVQIHVDNLPDLDANSTEGQIQEYATRTFITEAHVRAALKANKELPRSLSAIPVEVAGSKWGVLVVDSRNPCLMGKKKIFDLYNSYASILSKLLKEV